MVEEGDTDPNHTKKCHFIDIMVRFEGSSGEVKITWVYGHTVWEKWVKVWNEIRQMGSIVRGSWMCIGDFNNISYSYEKEGGPKENGFHQCIHLRTSNE